MLVSFICLPCTEGTSAYLGLALEGCVRVSEVSAGRLSTTIPRRSASQLPSRPCLKLGTRLCCWGGAGRRSAGCWHGQGQNVSPYTPQVLVDTPTMQGTVHQSDSCHHAPVRNSTQDCRRRAASRVAPGLQLVYTDAGAVYVGWLEVCAAHCVLCVDTTVCGAHSMQCPRYPPLGGGR
jgi:hypothetical protein